MQQKMRITTFHLDIFADEKSTPSWPRSLIKRPISSKIACTSLKRRKRGKRDFTAKVLKYFECNYPLVIKKRALYTGLYHKIIMQSGAMLCPWAFNMPKWQKVFELVEKLGKRTTDLKEAGEFLQTADAEQIVAASKELLTTKVSTSSVAIAALYTANSDVFILYAQTISQMTHLTENLTRLLPF